MKTAILTIMLAVSASAQSVRCYNLASGDGIVSPGMIVRCTGVPVAEAVGSQHPNDPETTLGGVTLSVGGQLAQLRSVGPEGIVAILPDFPTGWRFRTTAWITAGDAVYAVRLATANAAPGIFSNWGERPQGVAYSQKELFIIEYQSVPNNETRVQLICTGTLRAKRVIVLVNGAEVRAVNTPFPAFKGLDYVTFDLPANVHGTVTLQVVGDDLKSNQLSILVE